MIKKIKEFLGFTKAYKYEKECLDKFNDTPEFKKGLFMRNPGDLEYNFELKVYECTRDYKKEVSSIELSLKDLKYFHLNIKDYLRDELETLIRELDED